MIVSSLFIILSSLLLTASWGKQASISSNTPFGTRAKQGGVSTHFPKSSFGQYHHRRQLCSAFLVHKHHNGEQRTKATKTVSSSPSATTTSQYSISSGPGRPTTGTHPRGALHAFLSTAEAARAIPKEDDRLQKLGSNLLKYWYSHVPKPLRFFVSGRFGDVCFFLCEQKLSVLLSSVIGAASAQAAATAEPTAYLNLLQFLANSQDTISFLGGFFLHIVPQHFVHALLVYGLDTIDTKEKYKSTLFGMYQALAATAVASTFVNTALLKTLALSKTSAFVATLLIFSVINYFWLGWVVQRSKDAGSQTSAVSQTTM